MIQKGKLSQSKRDAVLLLICLILVGVPLKVGSSFHTVKIPCMEIIVNIFIWLFIWLLYFRGYTNESAIYYSTFNTTRLHCSLIDNQNLAPTFF